MKHIVAFGAVIAAILSMVLLIYKDKTTAEDYSKALQLAQQYEADELYFKAIEAYRQVVSLVDDDIEYRLAIIRDYEKLGDMETATSLAETLVESEPENKESYYMLLDFYERQENYKNYIPLSKKAGELFPDDAKIQEHINKIEKLSKVLGDAYVDITEFKNDVAMARSENAVSGEAVYVQVDAVASSKEIETTYQQLKTSDEEKEYLVEKDDVWMRINGSGYPVAKSKENGFDEVGIMSQGYAYAVQGSKYYLLNSELKKSNISWDYVGTFSEGVAPIKIGTKWGIMKVDEISDNAGICKYEDIAVDEDGRCCVNDRIFVKEGGKYYLINSKGERVCDTGFEDAKCFASSQPTAVKTNGKWGYIAQDGSKVFDPSYEDAKPFSNDYAPVCKDGKWGVISKKNEIVVDPIYAAIKGASSKGIIPVMDAETQCWDLVCMYKAYYAS